MTNTVHDSSEHSWAASGSPVKACFPEVFSFLIICINGAVCALQKVHKSCKHVCLKKSCALGHTTDLYNSLVGFFVVLICVCVCGDS